MALVNKGVRIIPNQGGIVMTVSVPLANGDFTQWMDIGACLVTRSMQVGGTFGAGGSVQVEQSNDGATPVILGSAVVAAGLAQLSSQARFFRFNCTAGDGTTALTPIFYSVAQRGS